MLVCQTILFVNFIISVLKLSRFNIYPQIYMTINELLKRKKEFSDKIKSTLSLSRKNKAIWLIKLEANELLIDLLDWLSRLPSNFVIYWDNISSKQYDNIVFSKDSDSMRVWFDFFVCDDCDDSLKDYMSDWVTPIIIEKNHFSSLLSEYNPSRSEWNCYIYKDQNKWSIFYAISRYLENFKFSFDNRNLVKNVQNI